MQEKNTRETKASNPKAYTTKKGMSSLARPRKDSPSAACKYIDLNGAKNEHTLRAASNLHEAKRGRAQSFYRTSTHRQGPVTLQRQVSFHRIVWQSRNKANAL
jgi:hypothetical protein